jgi:hypothetical protein
LADREAFLLLNHEIFARRDALVKDIAASLVSPFFTPPTLSPQQPSPDESPADRTAFNAEADLNAAIQALRAQVPDLAERSERIARLLSQNATVLAAQEKRLAADTAARPMPPTQAANLAPVPARQGESPPEAKLRRVENRLQALLAAHRAAADSIADPSARVAFLADFQTQHRALFTQHAELQQAVTAEVINSPLRTSLVTPVPPTPEPPITE